MQIHTTLKWFKIAENRLVKSDTLYITFKYPLAISYLPTLENFVSLKIDQLLKLPTVSQFYNI